MRVYAMGKTCRMDVFCRMVNVRVLSETIALNGAGRGENYERVEAAERRRRMNEIEKAIKTLEAISVAKAKGIPVKFISEVD